MNTRWQLSDKMVWVKGPLLFSPPDKTQAKSFPSFSYPVDPASPGTLPLASIRTIVTNLEKKASAEAAREGRLNLKERNPTKN